jgi:hypothetical protein
MSESVDTANTGKNPSNIQALLLFDYGRRLALGSVPINPNLYTTPFYASEHPFTADPKTISAVAGECYIDGHDFVEVAIVESQSGQNETLHSAAPRDLKIHVTHREPIWYGVWLFDEQAATTQCLVVAKTGHTITISDQGTTTLETKTQQIYAANEPDLPYSAAVATMELNPDDFPYATSVKDARMAVATAHAHEQTPVVVAFQTMSMLALTYGLQRPEI